VTVAARFDAPRPGSAALDRRVNPISGALEVRYPLTWTGVRTYRHADGRVTRELRRPEQVFAPSHLRTLRRLVATIGHPQLEDGTQVFLDARGGPGVADPDGTALRPAEDYQVGHTGDEIEREEVGGYPVPVAWCSVTSQRAQRMIAGGALQSSLGYLAYLDIHDTPQVWDGPSGPELYDVEHVLDHEDPRVLAAMARGEVRVARAVVDGAEVDVPVLGGNHLAIAIRAGRGGLQSEVRLDACCDACREQHPAPRRGRQRRASADRPPRRGVLGPLQSRRRRAGRPGAGQRAAGPVADLVARLRPLLLRQEVQLLLSAPWGPAP
jgi:hypothetical protein